MKTPQTTQLSELIPVRIIEARKCPKGRPVQFLSPDGKPWTTEQVVQDNHIRNGLHVVRAEVKLWFAFFGLILWEEIFFGHKTPTLGAIRHPLSSAHSPYWFNDIPPDLFQGDQFYSVRRERIEARLAQLSDTCPDAVLDDQLRRFGTAWTRIIFEGEFHGDFRYKQVLGDLPVRMMLRAIDRSWFYSIIHRIAVNPNDNRAGLPDFLAWNEREFRFTEAKRLKEKFRPSQVAWLNWMHERGMPVEVVRVKASS
jgi:hypothetical protein